MPKPAAVSALLIAFILVTIIAESASWRKKSTGYRKRDERKFWRRDFSHHLMKGGRICFRYGNADIRDKGDWWKLPQNFGLDTNNQDTFIVNFTDYPIEMLKQILKREGGEHQDVFGADDLYQEDPLRTRIRQQEETKLCPSREEIVFPQAALNKNNEWKYIVNVEKEYVQGVRVETCGHFDKCSMSESFPAGYTAMCEQKYVYRRLLAVTDKGKTKLDEFRMPSCCSCVVKGPFPG